MEKTIYFNDFCANKECKEYIAWGFDGGGCEYPTDCESCKLMGQSYDITEYPKNCLFLKDIQSYEREQQQALNIPHVINMVCPKCGNTGRCGPRTLSSPDGQECDCRQTCL